MKTIIDVTFHRPGALNDVITRMVTNNNSGHPGKSVTMADIRIRCRNYYQEWLYSPEIQTTESVQDQVMAIHENDNLVMTLHWKQVYDLELTGQEADLVVNQDLS